MDSSLAQKIANQLDSTTERITCLDLRHLRIAELVAEEYSIPQVADMLRKPDKDVRDRLNSACNILGVRSLPALSAAIYWKELKHEHDPGKPNRPLDKILSSRELDVISLFMEDMSDADMAARLGNISLRTLRQYIGSIKEKLGHSTRVEVARFVVREIFFTTRANPSPVSQ